MKGGRREGRGIKAALIISLPFFGADLAIAVSCPQGITVFFVAGTALVASENGDAADEEPVLV